MDTADPSSPRGLKQTLQKSRDFLHRCLGPPLTVPGAKWVFKPGMFCSTTCFLAHPVICTDNTAASRSFSPASPLEASESSITQHLPGRASPVLNPDQGTPPIYFPRSRPSTSSSLSKNMPHLHALFLQLCLYTARDVSASRARLGIWLSVPCSTSYCIRIFVIVQKSAWNRQLLSKKKERAAWLLLLWITKKCTFEPLMSGKIIQGRSWDAESGSILLLLWHNSVCESDNQCCVSQNCPKLYLNVSLMKGSHHKLCEAKVHLCKLLEHTRLSHKLCISPFYRHEPSR